MSPNEFQLRAALRDGEGEHVNPDTVIAHARGVQQARHDRRVRYGSVAAAVAIVGGIGVTGGVVLSGGGEHKATSASKGGTNHDSAGQAPGGSRAAASRLNPAAAPGPMSAAAALPCPDAPPKLMLPGGGGSGQFGSQGALFSDQVAAVKVCVYAGSTATFVPSTTLTGGSASDLTRSLEQADKTPSASIKCSGGPVPTDGGARSLVVIGVDKDGKQLKPVVVTLSCPTQVTNGTALRYNWTPPADIEKLINQQVIPNPSGGPISLPPSAKVTGSPINS